MNADSSPVADDIEVACFAGGEDVGEFCGQIFAATMPLLTEEQRDELADDRETFNRWAEGMFAPAVDARAARTRNPKAFNEGWWIGFKAAIERAYPVE